MTTPINLKPAPRVNFMYAMMKAVGRDQDSMSLQQITDSKSTMLAVTMEQNMYRSWNGILQTDDQNISAVDPGSDNAPSIINQLQSKYNVDASTAQSMESQQDGGMVQPLQGQASSDANNLGMKAQTMQGLNTLQAALSSILASPIIG